MTEALFNEAKEKVFGNQLPADLPMEVMVMMFLYYILESCSKFWNHAAKVTCGT